MNNRDHGLGQERAIRVLVVDDSLFMRRAITRVISSTRDIEVVGAAGSGTEAIEMIAALNPDVMTLDVVMPGEDGLTVLERVMRECPVPTLMVSSLTTENADCTIAALEAGAVDFVAKPPGLTYMEMPRIAAELTDRIRAAAKVDVRTLQRASDAWRRGQSAVTIERLEEDAHAADSLVVGCSTGGPAAIRALLLALPENLEKPVLVVQHMPVGFTSTLAARLDTLVRFPVREVRDGDLFEGGQVFIAQAGMHVRVRRADGLGVVLALDREPGDASHIPSVDLAMVSVADTLAGSAMGMLLTGMGTDGAKGLLAMRRAGAFTLAEDASSAIVWGMPRAAIELGAAVETGPLSRIVDTAAARLRSRSMLASSRRLPSMRAPDV